MFFHKSADRGCRHFDKSLPWGFLLVSKYWSSGRQDDGPPDCLPPWQPAASSWMDSNSWTSVTRRWQLSSSEISSRCLCQGQGGCLNRSSRPEGDGGLQLREDRLGENVKPKGDEQSEGTWTNMHVFYLLLPPKWHWCNPSDYIWQLYKRPSFIHQKSCLTPPQCRFQIGRTFEHLNTYVNNIHGKPC